MIRKVALGVMLVACLLAFVSCSEDSTKPKDAVNPTVSLVTPWDNTTRSGMVEVSVDADDDAGIARVDVFANGQKLGSLSSTPYVIDWDMSALGDGSTNTVYAVAVDNNGNSAKSAVVTVTVGVTAAPVCTLSAPAPGMTIAQGDKLTMTGSATDAEDGTLGAANITWISDQQGTLGTGTTLEHRGLVIGMHTITMKATDSNGISTVATTTVTVTSNTLDYATVEAGTYTICEPVFKPQTVVLTRPYHVWKTEYTIQELLTDMEYLYSIEKEDGQITVGTPEKYADGRNKKLALLYPEVLSYSSASPISAVYADYPACCITLLEACLACNGMSHRDGLTQAYIFLRSNGSPADKYASPANVKYIMIDRDADGWRLPTEAEWEVAARAGKSGMVYPWGDGYPGQRANSMTNEYLPEPLVFADGRGVVKVKSFAPNQLDLYEVGGNVAEMTMDMLTSLLPSGVNPYSEYESDDEPRYIVKGGTWWDYDDTLKIGNRKYHMPIVIKDKDGYTTGFGFRPVRFAD